ncbi:unnamed protein product [Penicillium palitans]
MAERNAQPGDNWTHRYDCMRFHVPTSLCHLPYMDYDKKFLTPYRLSKDDLASQRWIVKFQTPAGQRTAISKHVVMATGFGSQKMNIPSIAESHLYKEISIHSGQYKNAEKLKEKGAKSAIVIGSANTAFDILGDCHAAGLQTTMNVRSPTYMIPVEHLDHPASLGAYDAGVERADNIFMTLPSFIDAQLARGLLANFASQEPDRYKALAATGFPVLDSTNPECALMQNLIERAGGHYVDVGGTKLLEEGKACIKANVEPVAYTATGLRFSDGSHVDVDAVIWCTGFADKNVRETAIEILGASASQVSSSSHDDKNGEANGTQKLGTREIAARIDATWGVDSEGEIRGLWKRQSRLDGFWVMGGYTQQHGWHSLTLALQIKAALEGVLPPAYLDTPMLNK